MKNLLKTIILVTTFFVSLTFALDEGYDKMAKEFSEVAGSLKEGKIAIVPFSYADGRKSEGGIVVSERLTTRIVKLKKLKVIERQMLEKVLQELHLESSGVVGSEDAKQIGKILGVEAIITGTLVDIGTTRTEINARMILTETAEIIATSSVEVDKVWDISTSVQPVVQQSLSQPQSQIQPAYTSPSASPSTARKDATFFDLMFGKSEGTMDLVFANDTYGVSETDVNFDLDGNPNVNLKYKKLSFNGLKIETLTGPIALRFCGFPEDRYLGLGLELFYVANRLVNQKTTLYADSTIYDFTFYSKDYLDIKTFIMNFDLYVRLGKKFLQPYIGFGVGMSFDGIYSPYIRESSISTLNALGIGLAYHIPYGIRIKLGKNAAVFVERRSENNTIWFNRGRTSDSDSITFSLSHTLIGLNLNF
jgi:TolB-like protein